jgi:Na+/H+ antiporter NhaA
MSIFLAGLAFKEGELLNLAKLGIFAASLLAGIIGSMLLLPGTRRQAANTNHAR